MLLFNIEENTLQHHSEHQEKQAPLLSTKLKDMDIKNIISIANTKPDFIEIFLETKDQIDQGRHTTQLIIEDLIISASKDVSGRKADIQTGFRKLSYPQFNGDALNYIEFKKRWTYKVVSEQKPLALELLVLRNSVSAIAKANIADSNTMVKAWMLLDLNHGNL